MRNQIKELELSQWHPCKLNPEAHQRLKLASALSGRDMRDLASEAVAAYCNSIISRQLNRNDIEIDIKATRKRRNKKS